MRNPASMHGCGQVGYFLDGPGDLGSSGQAA